MISLKVSTLCVLTLLCFSRVSSASSDTFFLNCGSSQNATVNNRTFVSDNNLGREIFDSTQTISLTATDSNSLPPGTESTLFQTARVFPEESTYRFKIDQHGWFLIRLYFLPFPSSSRDLTSARFSVSSQNFTLFRHHKPSTTSVVKEYSLNISTGTLSLQFRPEVGSFAFINALEVFRLPENLLPEEAGVISTQSSKKTHKLSTHAMETVSRINMGNLSVSRDQDKLWRQWDADSTYMGVAHFGLPVTNLKAVNFSAGNTTEDIAPVYVYGTATRLNSEDNPNTNANLTWTFKVDPGFDYFLRFHFCNIIVDPFGSVRRVSFDIYVNSQRVVSVDMSEVANGTFGAPFFVDAVMLKAMMGLGGDLTLSVGGVMDVSSYPLSFLNGLEILKLSNDKRSLDASDAVLPDGSLGNKSPRIGLIAGVSAALCVALVFCVICFAWCARKRRNRQMQSGDEEIKEIETGESLIFSSSKIGYRYPLALIKEATNDFNESLVIGVGGFGKVYKGVLSDKTEIAVKRAAPKSRQGLAEFKTEIEMLSQFRHRHLVSLIGYCDENSEMIIVYEYMEKGTLKDHLYDSENQRLSWRQRLEICVGAARGLHYLHTGSARAVIHRDVKSANILLDENFMAKVADFGLSKTGPDLDQTHVSTAVKGSFGYLDPEYLTRQQLTEKSDVYSFGVVMLEVLCGRPVIDPSLPREKVNLIEWGMKLVKKGKMEEILDPFLDGKVKVEEVKKYCELTEKCLAQNGVERPTMGDLLWNLEFMLQVQAKDEKAAMVDDGPEASVVGSTVQFSVNGMGDIEGVSMSKVFARMVVGEETRERD
ncbi:putative receptor-like protein kinase [Raphanus sativus]|uniref:Probable receptor-like protein kinase At2g39360 n=1 Tax=Raphanus sativus TaxID=3726 RepID=A0A6J0MX63_RAPSA|nr:probable receptor-like protein kinase At2g39360 [Raphanus sativus]KAJ4906786.1 putative receptor-like protein kinase [Raphanus sativus]